MRDTDDVDDTTDTSDADDAQGVRLVAVDRIVGLAEVSEIIGEQRSTVNNWFKRSNSWNFPHPIAVLRCGPIWDMDDVLAWMISGKSPAYKARRSNP